jgi:outer membrane protein OmpA-like peptidoglycan-associated protein/subtilisin family serine protease
MDPALKELMKGSGDDEVEAIVRLDPEGNVPPHVRVIARFGEIATVRLPRERIAETWADESVVSLKAARPFGLDPDPLPAAAATEAEDLEEETEDRRRPEGIDATGRGVVVAVLDWGFDFAHPNFRNRDGSTRALALWDQAAPGRGPEPYGYGRLYTREEIDRALRHDEPYRALGYHPASGDPTGKGAHGTHVLDIAAGNGRAEGAPLGIAPEADLLFVHLATRGGIGEQASLGNSVTLLEGLDWVNRMAGGRSWVVNMSVGRHGGPHTGLTLVEQGLDALLAAAPGRAVVQSTGNYYAARVHASGYLRPGHQHTLRWCTDQADVTPNELEVWYPGRDVFGLEVRSPDGRTEVRVPLGGQAAIEIGGREVGRAYHRAKDPGSGDNHVDIFLDPRAPAGCWQVVLTGEDVIDGRFHAWVERDAGCPSCQSRLDPGDADPATTTGTIANGFRSITVGAYDAHSGDRTLGAFSSCGPTRDGRLKPDLLAPGVRVLAARSASLDLGSDTPLLTRYSGTSMAAPHVTGTVALMFEAAARPLTIQETRKLLLSTTQPVRLEGEPAMRLGSGYLDIERAVEAARSFATPPHAESAPESVEVEEEPAPESVPGSVPENFPEIVEPAEAEPEPLAAGPEKESETEEAFEEAFETEPEDAMQDDERHVHPCGCAARESFAAPEPEAEPHECGCRSMAREDVEESEPEAVYDEAYDEVYEEAHVEADDEADNEADTDETWEPAAGLIELADGVATAGGSLLDSVLARAESAGGWWEASLSPATLFDSIVAGGALRKHFVPAFEILALPGETPLEPLEPGDLLVRRSLGEGGLGHVAMVAAGETWAAGDLAGAGLVGETPRPGRFVQVVEGGFQPHGLADGFARRALDETGRLPFDQVLLRPRSARPAWSESGTPAGAVCAGPSTVLDDFGEESSKLIPGHDASLATLAKTIVDSQATPTPVETVCLVGHTDSSGDDVYNVGLGKKRASAAEAALRKKVEALSPGLPARLKFDPTSKGETSPAASNSTAAGKAKNRRVEITLGRGAKRVCPNPPVSTDDPTALSLFPVGKKDYGPAPLNLGSLGTFTVQGSVFFPAESAGSSTDFNKSIKGPVPIVVMAHGNHRSFTDPADPDTDHCTDSGGLTPVLNHKGFDYFQELLARMGIIAVSVDCNETCDFGASATNVHTRAALVLASIQHFQSLHSGSDPTFGGHIDFARLGLMGHSRGGEAVLDAAGIIQITSFLAKLIGFSALDLGVKVQGVLALAPSDLKATGGKPSGFPFLTILPAADGDVVTNAGAKFYDQAVPSPFKCQIYVDGANHNRFNRRWTNEDSLTFPGILGRSVHEKILSAYGGAFFRDVLLGHSMRKFLRVDELPPGVPADKIHVSFESASATTVDDYEDTAIGVNTLGQATAQSGGLTADQFPFGQSSTAFNSSFFGNTNGMVAKSVTPPGRFSSQLAAPVDLTDKEIWIRAAEVYDGSTIPPGATGFRLGLEDAAGTISFVDSKDVGGLPRPFHRKALDALIGSGSDFTKTMPTTLRYRASCFFKKGFDITKVKAVWIEMDRADKRPLAFDQLQIV